MQHILEFEETYNGDVRPFLLAAGMNPARLRSPPRDTERRIPP